MSPRFSIADVLTSPAGEGFFNGFQARKYDKGGMVCMGEGDENGIFVVMDGKLRVYLLGEEREMTLFYLLPGEMFCTHSGCLVESVVASELRFADIGTFSRKIEECPAISFGLVSILGKALMSCMRTIEDLTFHNIQQRIASFFVDRAGADGVELPDGGIEVALGLTTEEIANLLGSSRQTTSTALNSLIRDGYLRRKSRTEFIIVDRAKLKAIAAGGRSAMDLEPAEDARSPDPWPLDRIRQAGRGRCPVTGD